MAEALHTACVGLHLGFTEAPKPAAPALTTMCGLREGATVGHSLPHYTSGQRGFKVVVKVKWRMKEGQTVQRACQC